jgi:hypothetical protein
MQIAGKCRLCETEFSAALVLTQLEYSAASESVSTKGRSRSSTDAGTIEVAPLIRDQVAGFERIVFRNTAEAPYDALAPLTLPPSWRSDLKDGTAAWKVNETRIRAAIGGRAIEITSLIRDQGGSWADAVAA